MNTAPFREGETVWIKGDPDLGAHRVDSCERFERTAPGVAPYWLVEATAIREPVDWSKIPPGSTGVVVGGGWSGSAERLTREAPRRESVPAEPIDLDRDHLGDD